MKEPCSDTMLVTDEGIETIRVTSEIKVSQGRSKYKEKSMKLVNESLSNAYC